MLSYAAMPKKPVVLIIRDGWGINPGGRAKAVENGDATLLAKTPFHDHLYATYPQATLSASGMDVGLPEGQMGNSEVGHLNLGAGRIVYQDLTRINKAIKDGELAKNPVLVEAFAKAKGHPVCIFSACCSDGGVHYALRDLSHRPRAKAAHDAGVDDIMVHAITDGRDTSPTGGADYLAYTQAGLAPSGAKIATVVGRYYAMDRDKRWERNKLAWDAIVLGRGPVSDQTPSAAVRAAYSKEPRGDEFLTPIIFSHANEQRVRDGDVVLWFNFRADRARQLSLAFLKKDFNGFDREVTPAVYYVTLTEYDETYGVPVVFAPQSLKNILGEVVSAAGLTQLRIAETEKYPHVTFFFNGGVEAPFAGEDRSIVPSSQGRADLRLQTPDESNT